MHDAVRKCVSWAWLSMRLSSNLSSAKRVWHQRVNRNGPVTMARMPCAREHSSEVGTAKGAPADGWSATGISHRVCTGHDLDGAVLGV